jgi:hypothetical protein
MIQMVLDVHIIRFYDSVRIQALPLGTLGVEAV